MGRTAVPEAAVDEHSHFRPREHDVGPAANGWLGSDVDAVPQPATMQNPPDGELRRSVPGRRVPHSPRHRLTRRTWCAHSHTLRADVGLQAGQDVPGIVADAVVLGKVEIDTWPIDHPIDFADPEAQP